MKRTKPGRGLPRTLAARTLIGAATIALLGLTASGRAEPGELAHKAPATSAQADGPVFVPGADPRFAEAFAELAGQTNNTATAITPASGAVDMLDIEPAPEAAAQPAPARSLGSGVASYYADMFNGRRTASGERFSNTELTAAHRTLPFGSRVRVTNPRNGASVVVRINDRGPFVRGRTIDLSRAAAEQVGIVRAGHGSVELELIEG